MTIKALVYGGDQTKEDILRSAFALSLPCNMIVISSKVTEETIKVNDQIVRFLSCPAESDYGDCMNELLLVSEADYVFFPRLEQSVVPGSIAFATNEIEHKNAPAFTFGAQGKKNASLHPALNRGLSDYIFRLERIKQGGVRFVRGTVDYRNAIEQCFLQDALRWPSKCLSIDVPLYDSSSENAELTSEEKGYLARHRGGAFWLVGLIGLFARNQRKREMFKSVARGKDEYLNKNFVSDEVDKNSLAALIISSIALAGFAVQLVLTFIVTFTETQYIPVWAALGFLALFSVLYAFSIRKVGYRLARLIVTLSVGLLCFSAILASLLVLKTSVYLSIFAAVLGAIFVGGLNYCFTPARRPIGDSNATRPNVYQDRNR